MKEMIKQGETFDEKIINYSDEEINNMFEADAPEIDLDEVENEIIATEEILVNKKEYDFLLDFYRGNSVVDYGKISKNMEKIVNEATIEVFEKCLAVLDTEEKTPEKIYQKFNVYENKEDLKNRKF